MVYPEDEQVTFTSHSNGTFDDLCRGGHVESTGRISAFKLLSAAGAYWRGSEANPMLQRDLRNSMGVARQA